MILGRVIGTVWATRKDPGVASFKFLIVRHLDLEEKPLSGFDIAVDTVQAGVGDLVLVAKGSSARQTRQTEGKPVDAVVMAVVEGFHTETLAALTRESQTRERQIAGTLGAVAED